MSRYLPNRDDFFSTARIALLLGSLEKVAAYWEIRRLNEASTSAWERGNNSGDPEYLARMEDKSNLAYNKAEAIAKRHGWALSAPGLYWEVVLPNGEELR